MAIIDLLRRQLKDPEIIELLEMSQSDVIYDFDRCDEGTPDGYHVSIPEERLELVFDASQRLITIFVDFSNKEASDIEGEDGFPILRTIADAVAYAQEIDTPHHQGTAKLFGAEVHWLRIDYPAHSVHYEYGSSGLQKVTVMTSETAPKRP